MTSLAVSLRELQSFPARQWLGRAAMHLPRILAAVLMVAIAWQLVNLLWLLLEPSPAQDPGPIHPAPGQAFQIHKGIDVQSIADAHLFGVPQTPSGAAEPAPQTRMNLALSAVFAGNDPRKGFAIIGESAQSGKVYATGAAIRPRTRLHEVYADRVILDNAGKLEALLLPKLGSSSVAISRIPPPANAPRQFAESLREIAQNNPGALAEIVRAQPVFAGGVQRGFRVYPGRNRQQFAQSGLRPGDLVIAINGTPLDDPQRGREIFDTLASSGQASLTVERNGQSHELTLNTAQITLPSADLAGSNSGAPSANETADAAPP
ncbi:general secretion pathway protein C [Steroidobacter denitrificans]|uniref:General secretion pathway protein C n=1 Tax=Steroidobacter denitrificans TaxID=465721 RepID=A0A127F9W9_STEDE|nr:type II secretion system protein GspC [Steroidobacter denitrificans]AMN47216.1 general secretion pathway protein C [Steroidobacter denitrificans]